MRKWFLPVLFYILLATIAVTGAWAHPHVFIDASLEFEMRGRSLEGLWIEWIFDPVFSADVIGQFDRNRDKAFSDAESELVQAKAFSNLAKYGYFTFVRQGDTRFTPPAIEKFKASQRDGRAVYRFRVPLEGRGLSDDVSIAAFDSTFYCAIRISPETTKVIRIGDETAGTPRLEIAVNKRYPVYYNPAGGAGDKRVYFKWEKGLQTAYPEEIRVLFE